MRAKDRLVTSLCRRILGGSFLLILGFSVPRIQALVFSGAAAATDLAGKRDAHIAGWGHVDLSGVVLVRSPYGVTSSGILLESGRHVLTAAHCVAGFCSPDNGLKGRVEVFSGNKQKIIPWEKVSLHPAYSQGGAWDAGIIELAREVDAGFAARYQLARSPRLLPEMILRAGWGKGGTGITGENGSTGKLLAGLNHHEARTRGKLTKGFRCGSDHLPLLLSDFDGGAGDDPLSGFAASVGLDMPANPGAGALECQIANGDSGGPVFARDASGQTVVVALQVGRISRGADIDHRLNSSWGELAVDVEACRISDWILTVISR
jgi:secreted trypsin-like serine protease